MLICHIEKLIKNSGLRKDYIANYLGVTTRQVRKYERMENGTLIPMDKAYTLAKLLNCKVDDLYEEE